MKILYVQDTDWMRNPIPHTFISERLVRKGHQVRAIDYEVLWRKEGKRELVSKRRVFQASRTIDNAPVTIIRPGIVKIPVLDYFSMLFSYGKEIDRQIREFKPDILIGDCILTTYLGYRAARKRNIPTLFYTLDTNYRLIPFKFLQPLGKMIESANIKNADLVLSVNIGLRDYTLEMGARAENTRVLNAGFDSSRFEPGITGSEIRGKYGIKDGDILLSFVGWIHHFNGLKEVALELAKTPGGRIKLLVVGDGDGLAELRRIREANNLQDRLILTGRLPHAEVPGHIAASDICLLTAKADEPIMRDIVPMKMWEYMAMKKPVISIRLPGMLKEFGEDNGIVYVDRPEDTIAKAVELAEKGLTGKLGARARAFVEQHSWDTIADEFEKVLEGVIVAKRSSKHAGAQQG